MHIQHSNPHTSTLGHGGREYHALRDGIFQVPDEVGEQLIPLAHWSRYMGEAPYEVATTPTAEALIQTRAADAAALQPPSRAAAEPSVPEPIDWFAKGEEAARADAPRLPLPDDLKDRPRHRDARTYLAGHDSVTHAEVPPE